MIVLDHGLLEYAAFIQFLDFVKWHGWLIGRKKVKILL